jgi:hypothetical protein
LAVPTTLDFEAVGPQGTDVGSFYSGLPGGPVFFGATILQVPFYNYTGYPPESGINVAYSCCTGEIDITWATAVSGVGFYIDNPAFGMNYVTYDIHGNIVSAGGVPNTSYGNPGIDFSVPGSGIVQLTIIGAADFYVIDDVTYNATPEPGTLTMLGSGALALAGFARRKFMR